MTAAPTRAAATWVTSAALGAMTSTSTGSVAAPVSSESGRHVKGRTHRLLSRDAMTEQPAYVLHGTCIERRTRGSAASPSVD